MPLVCSLAPIGATILEEIVRKAGIWITDADQAIRFKKHKPWEFFGKNTLNLQD